MNTYPETGPDRRNSYREAAARVPYVAILSGILLLIAGLAVLAPSVVPRYIPVVITASISVVVGAAALFPAGFRLPFRAATLTIVSMLLVVMLRYFPFFSFHTAPPTITVVFVITLQLVFSSGSLLPFAVSRPLEYLSLPGFTAGTIVLFNRLQGEPGWFVAVILALTFLLCALFALSIRMKSVQLRMRDSLVETRRLNDRLAAATANLMEQRQQQLLAALSAGIAHEINNPMNHMIGNLDFLEHDLETLHSAARRLVDMENAESAERVEEAKSSATKIIVSLRNGATVITSVVARLRDLFRSDGAAPRSIVIRDLVDTVITTIERAPRGSRRIAVAIDESLAIVCHPGDLYAIVANIARNAYEAIDPDGTVRIEARETADRIRIDVIDDGCGIPEAVIGRVFDPFYTSKESRGGFGIGLTLARSLVDKMRGTLSIESAEGEGTRVRIDLPRSAAIEESARAPYTPPA
jgi:signal transduction histidine kinase